MDCLFDSGRMLLKLAEAAELAVHEAMHSIHDLDQQVETLTAENTRLKAEQAQLGEGELNEDRRRAPADVPGVAYGLRVGRSNQRLNRDQWSRLEGIELNFTIVANQLQEVRDDRDFYKDRVEELEAKLAQGMALAQQQVDLLPPEYVPTMAECRAAERLTAVAGYEGAQAGGQLT